jgi:hypothetical protein
MSFISSLARGVRTNAFIPWRAFAERSDDGFRVEEIRDTLIGVSMLSSSFAVFSMSGSRAQIAAQLAAQLLRS